MTGSGMEILPKQYEALAARYAAPRFYIQLKLMRLGEDLPGIEASVQEDLTVVRKIAADTGQSEPKVRHDFFMQLQAYRSEFLRWNQPVTPEELILKGLRPLQEKRYVGAKPKLAVLLEMGKPRKSVKNSTFRSVTFLVESDIPDSAWQLIRTTLWGAAPDVKVGEACHVILENNQGFTNVKECTPADITELPDPIPSDPRYRVQKLGASPPKIRKGEKKDGSGAYEFETCFLTLLIQNPQDPETTIVLDASSTFAQRWQDAPNDRVLNTIITEAKTDKGIYYNVGDWQESKNKTPLSWPELDTLISFTPQAIADYVGGYVIMDGTPTSIVTKDGAKGAFYVIGLHNFLTGDETSMMLRDNAYVEPGVMEIVEGRPYFLANRVKILTRISLYQDQNGKERISQIAQAIWNMDSVLPDLPEDLGITEEEAKELDAASQQEALQAAAPEVLQEIAPEDLQAAAPEVQQETAPEVQKEILPEEEPITTAQDLLKPEARTPIRPAQQEAVAAGIISQDEAEKVSQILDKGVPADHAHTTQPAEKKAPAKNQPAGLFSQKKKPADPAAVAAAVAAASAPEKGAITVNEQQRIANLRERMAAQKGQQKVAETPL